MTFYFKNTEYKVEKFVECSGYCLSEDALKLYEIIKEKATNVLNDFGVDTYYEKTYTAGLAAKLHNLGFEVSLEEKIEYLYENFKMPPITADLVVRGKYNFVVESKARDVYKGVKQLLGYMKHLSYSYGFVVGFTNKGVSVSMILKDEKECFLYKDGIMRRVPI